MQFLTCTFTLLGISNETHSRYVNASGLQSEPSDTMFRGAQVAEATKKSRDKYENKQKCRMSKLAEQRVPLFLLSCVTADTAVNSDICHSSFSKGRKSAFGPIRANKGIVKPHSLSVESDNSLALSLVILPSKSLQTALAQSHNCLHRHTWG